MPTLDWIGKKAVVNHHLDVLYRLSDIIDSFNERHGTDFTEEDFLRFEKVNQEIMNDDMREMLKNNPEDVVFLTFSQAFFKGAIRRPATRPFGISSVGK
jgi:hypothetical protein